MCEHVEWRFLSERVVRAQHLFCDANGQRTCDNPVYVGCTNGTWCDALCGVNGNMIGTCVYYVASCDLNFASPKP